MDKDISTVTSEVAELLNLWVAVWSSHQPEKVADLFSDDCVFEDGTFQVVTRGKEKLGGFVNGQRTHGSAGRRLITHRSTTFGNISTLITSSVTTKNSA